MQNNTANRVFHDVVTDFTKAFYFQNVNMFSRCTKECNSIYALPCAVGFHESAQLSAALCADLFMPNVTQIDSKCGKYG